jgi:hypothetical protein
MDPKAIADSLTQLTGGWDPGPGVSAEALTAARVALASSLAAGRTLAEIHAAQSLVSGRPPIDLKLSAALFEIATSAAAKTSPTIAIIRSAYAATLSNPSGVPEWARRARIVQSLGPFLDSSGVAHWVDLTLFTVSTQFAFGTASTPFAVFPIVHLLFPPATATHFNLGAESVWFLANWLNSGLPAGNFTGFSIAGGSLDSSEPMTLQSGVYVVPATATLTVTATLAAASSPINTGDPGADAAGAVFTPPSSVTITFTPSNAVFQSIGDAAVEAYGAAVTLHWNKGEVVAVAALPEIMVPCTASPSQFAFASSTSEIFAPSGSASIATAGWALPLVATSVTALPAAAGPGAALFTLGGGGALRNAVQTVSAMSAWLAEIATGGLYILAEGVAVATDTTYALWPQAAPSKLNATVDFLTNPAALYAYLSSSMEEILFTVGKVEAHLDRPVSATGARFPYMSDAALRIDQAQTSTLLTIIGARHDNRSVITPLVLENSVLGVDAPEAFILTGTLQDGTSPDTQVLRCVAAFYLDLRWLLPTLPDPYAANFDLSLVRAETDSPSAGTILAAITWHGGSANPRLDFILLPPAAAPGGSGVTPFPAGGAPYQFSDTRVPPPRAAMGATLLDLSTRIDLFGVSVAPEIGALTHQRDTDTAVTAIPTANPSQNSPAPLVAIEGMRLVLNGAVVATFALPQFSWEPMESTAAGQSGPIVCDPAWDGFPLLTAAPDDQQLVPFAPGPVLLNNIENVATGRPFAALFSLPFGLDALIVQPNHSVSKPISYTSSAFLRAGGRFGLNSPRFPNAFPPSPPVAAPPQPVAPSGPPKMLFGAVTLSLMPENPGNSDASFPGITNIDPIGATTTPVYPGYGTAVLGYDPTTQATDVADIFAGEFSSSAPPSTRAVPLRRIDFSGYGASTFSEWLDQDPTPPAVTKVQFEASMGRTALDVIQVVSVIYPWCIQVVRTITMQRQNAGWIKRSDSGWQAASPGTFSLYTGRVHPGALHGAYNVRNIRDQAQTVSFKVPASDPQAGKTFEFREVLFDADLAMDHSLNVTSGGFPAESVGGPSGLNAVASQNIVGYLQLSPDLVTPDANTLALLFDKTGPFSPAISCTVEAGRFSGTAGTVLRCSAFEVDMILDPQGSPSVPAIGVALRGAPQIPRAGGWSMGQRPYTDPAPSALPSDYPVPLVRPAASNDYWYIADVTDILQLAQPNNYYSLLHSTGTQKVLFESPQIPTSSTVTPPPPGPGLQFPQPGPPQPGGAPGNPGSPNLGDLASILNSTGLFPDLSSALSLMESGATEQINTISQGFQYSKSYTFPAGQQATIVDLDVMNIVLRYEDTPQTTTPPGTAAPTVLTYTVDSSASPSWTLSIGKFTLQVIVPLFGNDPVLWLTGGFYGDEHTAPGVTGLTIQFGGVLNIVQQVFSALQTVAQFLPGGATAELDVALSDGSLSVTDTFSIADMPLGLGNLTDISLDVGLNVQLQPLSVNFSVGIGAPDNPFNWIATPLAGTGLMTLGVQNSEPAFTIQAGIGLGIAIDLGIASGSASVTLAFQLNVDGNSVTLMVILTGQASVDVLDGLASASLTLSAGLGLGLKPAIPIPSLLPGPPEQLQIPSIEITLLASVSVGIHLTVCWVVSVSWDGSWQFSQSVSTPSLTVNV